MYASLRTYRIGSGSVDAVMRRVDRDFAEALSQEPGFVAYHAIDTGNDMDAVLRSRAFQFVELGEGGAGIAGGSRASAFALFRNALREAAQLSRQAGPTSVRGQEPDGASQPIVQNPNESRLYGRDAGRADDVLLTRFDAAALVPILRGNQLLLVHVERAKDN